MKKQLLLLFVSLLLGAARVSAQPIYPVTVAPQVMPPTPLYLSSLAEASYSYDPVRVQLLLNDLAIPNRQVRLKIYIEGNGYAAQSRDFVVGATPLILNSGLPLQLTHVDLAPYFAFQNLAGISPAQYAQALPEGLYQVCFEVYDAVSQARLSAKSCANTVIFRNQPPLLVAPARGVVVQEQNPPFIVFQWTPRHLNVSNVEYELSLVEVWDTGVDPQAAFLASPPLFTASTQTTSYVYGPTDPMLLTGKTYAWRVRARALVGADEVGLFVNNGYSEVFSFRYVSPCTAPQQVSAQQVSANMATVGWSETGQHLDYTVQYREKGNANWYTNTTPRNYLTINGLKPETAYQFQVAGNCDGGAATTSPVYEFTTLNREEAGYQGCNIDIAAANIANRQPLAQLFPGDLIMAGDFPVTVTQVEKNTPPFKGKGYTFISWLGDTKIGVEFNNITVNTDNQLISGEIKTTYDPTWGNVSFLSDIVDLSNGQAQEINFDRPIERVYIKENGQVVVVIQDASGQNVEVEYPGGKDYVIKGSDGKVYQVDEEGNITQGTEAEGGASTAANTQGVDSNGHVTQLSATGVKVFFEPAPNTVYGFDTLPAGQPALTSHYRSVPDGAGGSYPVIHKAVQNQATDALYARVQLTGASVKAEDVKFKTKAGVALTGEAVAGSPNTYRLSVSGISNFEKEEVQAYLLPKTEGGKQTIAGLFDLYSLGQKSVNVTLIPVNGASLDKNALEEQLNDIYRPAAVQFNLTIGSPFTVNPSDFDANGDSKLEIGTSELTSTYTEEERNIINRFKEQNTIASEMHYVFVCNNISTSRPVEGFMPLMRPYGFVFANAIDSGNDSNKEENKGNLAKVLAHELGHGAFGLRHPFDAYGSQPGATNFLMDYGGGTAFSHMDWERLHDPNFKLYLFQGDEEGELAGRVWFTPDWKPFRFDISKTTCVYSGFDKGVITGISYQGKCYAAKLVNGQYEYMRDGEPQLPIERITLNPQDKVSLMIINEKSNCGPHKEYQTTYEYAIANKANIDYTSSKVIYKGTWECPYNSEDSFFIKETLPPAINFGELVELESPEFNEKYHQLVNEAIQLLNNQIQVNQGKPNAYDDTYKYIIGSQYFTGDNVLFYFHDWHSVDNRQKQLNELEHRFEYLEEISAEKGNPISFYTLIMPVTIHLPNGYYNKFAEDVLKGSNLVNSVLVTVPFLHDNYNVGGKTASATYWMPGVYATTNVDFGKLGKESYQGINFPSFIQDVYTHTYKPYDIYVYAIDLGARISFTYQPNWISGKENINEYKLFYDRNIAKHNQYWLNAQKVNNPTYTPNAYEGQLMAQQNAEYLALQQADEYTPDWDQAYINLKDRFIPYWHANYLHEWIHKYEGIRIEYEFNLPSESVPSYAKIDPLRDDLFLAFVDFMSLITSPIGGDIVFDAIGAIYVSTVDPDNYEEIGIRTAGILPFVSGATLKAGTYGLKNVDVKKLKYFGKLQGAGNTLSKLDNILSKSGFSGANGIFSKLPRNTPNQISRYTSLQTFRNEFIRLHSLNASGIKSIDDVLDDFDFLVTNHSSVPNIEKYVDELMQSQNKFKGGAFSLEILSDLPPSLQGKTLTKFEASIDDLDDLKEGCRFDLQFTDETKFVYVETKNYAQSTVFSGSFYNQFKAYISNPNVTDVKYIKYFFKANNGVTKAERVQKFKNLINNGGNKEQFFNSLNPTIRNQFQIESIGDIDDAFLNTFLNSIIEVY